jgi:hypothetical protein
MRLYFDLQGPQHTLPDLHGAEVLDLEQARRVALEMIQQLREEDPSVAQDWSGWTLNVVDVAGVILFSIDLDNLVAWCGFYGLLLSPQPSVQRPDLFQNVSDMLSDRCIGIPIFCHGI